MSSDMDSEITEDDMVYMKRGDVLQKLGDGFSSAEEVEKFILDKYDQPGDYEFGVFENVGATTIEEPEPKTKTLTEEALSLRNEIREDAEEDDRVKTFSDYNDPSRNQIVSMHTHRIRYADGECDFGMHLNTDLFDGLPLSTLDESVEEEIKSIFKSIVGDRGVYLGFDSSYASRGRKDPYVKVVGRVNRNTPRDNEMQSLEDFSFVDGLYWSSENISPVPIYELKEDFDWGEEEIIAVFDFTDSIDSFDELSEDSLERSETYIQQIEEDTDMEVLWLGEVSFNREFHRVCVGLEYAGQSSHSG